MRVDACVPCSRTRPRRTYPVRVRPAAAGEGGSPFKPGRVRGGVLVLRPRFGPPPPALPESCP